MAIAGLIVHAVRDGKPVQVDDPAQIAGLIADGTTRLWLDLTDPEPADVERVAALVGLHPLVADDIIERNERAKVELIDGIIHVVMYALTRSATTERHEIDFALGRQFLLSVHPAAWDPSQAHQLKMGIEAILERGPDFLLWALVDSIVDGYFPVFDGLADEIDGLQDDVVNNAVPATLEHVFRLKGELVSLRHVIAPTREVFSLLTSREFDLIGEAQVFYFRDVYDHLIRLTDEFDSFRELAAGTLEVYLSTINNNLSVIMKRLTGVTVVLAGIAAIGGLFGMSEAGPALAGQEASGFWVVVVASILLGGIAVVLLRRINWL
ncbi:MAG TPA: magnesium transporter CorA family protein [Candidatus Limnocylindrales bacterium]|nr:magnesium transporter CorA family protein [Candidatus Limnocylindrales bacterium]